MFNVKPNILILLEEIPDVSVTDEYPKSFANLPHISFYELSNDDSLGIANSPLSDITIQIDIWNNRSTSGLAQIVNEKMNSIGFRRKFANDMSDPSGIKRKTMRYRGIIDARTGRVSQ